MKRPKKALRRWVPSLPGLVALLLAAAPPAPAAGTATPQPVGRRVLLLSEDFGSATLDARVWTTCYWWQPDACTNEGNRELQAYRASAVTVSGGQLHLTARRQATTGVLQDGTSRRFSYTSGMVSSHDRVAFQYGRVEFRARLPRGRGLWPALWLLPQSKRWPPEIDVMENLGDRPDRVYSTVHPADGSEPIQVVFNGPDLSRGFHTFAVDWTPQALTFSVDGRRTGRVTRGVPHEPMYVVMNLAVGGTWPGGPDARTRFPATLSVDHVRIWVASTSAAVAPQPRQDKHRFRPGGEPRRDAGSWPLAG